MAAARRKRRRFVPLAHKPLNLAVVAERTWRGVVYDSKTEMLRAQELDQRLRGGGLARVERQIKIPLGEDDSLRVDFRCTSLQGCVWCEDVKGFETRDFRRKVKLWRKYGPCTLRVLKLSGRKWIVEEAEGSVKVAKGQEHG